MRAAIALGSNIGHRLNHLSEARDLIKALNNKGQVMLQAPVYQSAPLNCPPRSPDFYNTVVEIGWRGTPEELLEATQKIEYHFGRHFEGIKNAPRIIDLDILYINDLQSNSEQLTLPHPRIRERRFVLQPLADIRPELILPGYELSIMECLRKLDPEEQELTLIATKW